MNISGEDALGLLLIAIILSILAVVAAIAAAALYAALAVVLLVAAAIIYPQFALLTLLTAKIVHKVQKHKENKAIKAFCLELDKKINEADKEIAEQSLSTDEKKQKEFNVRINPIVECLLQIKQETEAIQSSAKKEKQSLQNGLIEPLKKLSEQAAQHTEDVGKNQEKLKLCLSEAERFKNTAPYNIIYSYGRLKSLQNKIAEKEASAKRCILPSTKTVDTGTGIPFIFEYLIDSDLVDQKSFQIKIVNGNIREMIKHDLCVKAAIEMRDYATNLGSTKVSHLGSGKSYPPPTIDDELQNLDKKSNEEILSYFSQRDEVRDGRFYPAPDAVKRRNIERELHSKHKMVDESHILNTLEKLSYAYKTGEQCDALAAQEDLRSLALQKSLQKVQKLNERATKSLDSVESEKSLERETKPVAKQKKELAELSSEIKELYNEAHYLMQTITEWKEEMRLNLSDTESTSVSTERTKS